MIFSRQAKYYAGKILWVNLSSDEVSEVATSDYSEFLGGLGMAAKIYWDEVRAEVKPLDPESKLIFITGPLCGFPGIAGSRWQVVGKSPSINPGKFSYANLGGSWGAGLKFAGYDGIVVEGQAEKPVYLLLENGRVRIKDASHLWGKGAIEARDILNAELEETVNILSIGPAGENMAIWASILADKDASGGSGFGAVLGSKKLKAIAVRKGKQRFAPADQEGLRELLRYYRWLVGEGKFSYYVEMVKTSKDRPTRKDYCWGCGGPCIRESYRGKDGKKGKFVCFSAMFYRKWAFKYYENDDEEIPFRVTKLCDDMGLDIGHFATVVEWLDRCYQAGILTEEETGVPLSKVGSWEYAQVLLQEIASGSGIGKYLRLGAENAADFIGKGTVEILTDLVHKSAMQDDNWSYDEYGPREYIAHGIIYALDVFRRIDLLHEMPPVIEKWREWVNGREGAYVSSNVLRSVAKKFWGGEAVADFTSYEGKALAAKMIQDRTYAKNCLILCDWAWSVLTSPHTDNHVGDPTLESKLVSAITGQSMDENEFYHLGEKVFNLQRSIMIREGHQGRKNDSLLDSCFDTPLQGGHLFPEVLVPDKNGDPVSRKRSVVDRKEFERMKDEYYQLRGWDVATGLPSAKRLRALGLEIY